MSKLDNSSKYPSTWGQLYATYCGELAALIESLLNDTIDRAELRQLYMHYAELQHERVERMAFEAGKMAYDRSRRV